MSIAPSVQAPTTISPTREPTPRPSGTIGSALRHRSFRRLLIALAVSEAGDWLYNLALIALVFDRTHSPTWLGLTTAARVTPIVLLGPLGGLVASRYNRRRVMIGCDAVRLLLMLALAGVGAFGGPIVLAPLIAATASAAATPYGPCVAATTPKLVPDSDLPGANAARSAVTQTCVVAAPAIGVLLLLIGSPSLAVALNAVSFGLSAIAVLSVRQASTFVPVTRAGQRTRVVDELAAGLAALRTQREAFRLVGADIVCSGVYGTMTVLLVVVSRHLGLGTGGYGYLLAGFGGGGVLAAVFAGRVARIRNNRWVIPSALFAVALPLPLLATVPSPFAATGFAIISGAGSVSVEILCETTLQRQLPDAVFAHAYGFALPASLGGIVIGGLVAPTLLSVAGMAGAFGIVAAAVVAYALLFAVRSGGSQRKSGSTAAVALHA